MSNYAKISIVYLGAVVLVTAAVLSFRSTWISERSDWEYAVRCGTAQAYRNYYSKWRTSFRAAKAVLAWESALKREHEQLDLASPCAYIVENFIKTHPEFHESDIRSAQYDAVIKDGSYEVLKWYRDVLPQNDLRRDEIEKRIDSIIMAEVRPAFQNNDYQKLSQLSEKYSDWRGRQEWIDGRVSAARDNSAKVEWERLAHSRSELDLRCFINEYSGTTYAAQALKRIDLLHDDSAKAEWERLAHSKSELDLRRFINKYSGTTYAAQALKRIDLLYDDFDFVKSKVTLKAYLDFADNHPNSPQVNEAWRHVADELEEYVFKRKALGSNESLVRSTLARYKKVRPSSGGLYGTGGSRSSPLQITTPAYGGDDYFVKLVNKGTGGTVGIYVRSGTTTEVDIPDGTYSIRYATGSQWYGPRFLFGLNAHYSRAGKDFTFNNGSGYKLTLRKVANGNLHTSPMSASEF